MEKIIIGIIGIVVGCALILFREAQAKSLLDFYKRWRKITVTERQVRRDAFVTAVIGVAFVVFGIFFIYRALGELGMGIK